MPLTGSRTYGLKLVPAGSAAGANRTIGNDEFRQWLHMMVRRWSTGNLN